MYNGEKFREQPGTWTSKKKKPNKHRSQIDYRPEVAFIYRSTQSMDLNSEETS